MGDCLCRHTEAAGINVRFAIPLNQIGFAEAHRSSRAAGPERPYFVGAREEIPVG